MRLSQKRHCNGPKIGPAIFDRTTDRTLQSWSFFDNFFCVSALSITSLFKATWHFAYIIIVVTTISIVANSADSRWLTSLVHCPGFFKALLTLATPSSSDHMGHRRIRIHSAPQMTRGTRWPIQFLQHWPEEAEEVAAVQTLREPRQRESENLREEAKNRKEELKLPPSLRRSDKPNPTA